MLDLRLQGGPLRLLRHLAASPLGGLIWRAVSNDFGVGELLRLPPEARHAVEISPRPVRGGPPRRWDEAGLGAPVARPGSGRALQAAYARGEVSPVTVLARLRGRLERQAFGRAVHSPFVALDLARAQRAAEASEARLRTGRALGPLDGVPVPVKDQLDMEGLPTRGGCSYLEDPAARDAFVVQRLEAAGAVVYGKTHATEWGLNPLGVSEHFDLPRNVYASDRGAGGSSTGSGVAVALGLAPVAHASDGGGSIRVPASLNGVFGLKPTFIRLGRTGDLWGTGSVSHQGAIGRSVEDLVELLAATAGVDPADPLTAMAPPDATEAAGWRAALGRGVKGARLGVISAELRDVEAPLAAAVEETLRALEKEGAVLVETALPLAPAAQSIGAMVITAESTAGIADLVARYGEETGDEVGLVTALLKHLGGRELLLATRTRTALRAQTAQALAGVDLLVLPSTQRQAPPYGLDEGRRGLFMPAWTAAMTRFSFLANLTGLPAGVAPVGMHGGLPVAVQLVGDAWDESSVLAGMAHLERMGLCDLPAPEGFQPLA